MPEEKKPKIKYLSRCSLCGNYIVMRKGQEVHTKNLTKEEKEGTELEDGENKEVV